MWLPRNKCAAQAKATITMLSLIKDASSIRLGDVFLFCLVIGETFWDIFPFPLFQIDFVLKKKLLMQLFLCFFGLVSRRAETVGRSRRADLGFLKRKKLPVTS